MLFISLVLLASGAMAQHGYYNQSQDDPYSGGAIGGGNSAMITSGEMTRRSNLSMQESINDYNIRRRMEENSRSGEIVVPYQRQYNSVSAGNLNYAEHQYLSAETKAEKRKAKAILRDVQTSVGQNYYGME